MALINRPKRPINRNAGALRDDRLFIVACDDTYAPKQYFDSFQLARIHVHVVPTTDGSSVAKHVLERLKGVESEPDDERWMILDTDHCIAGSHVEGFLSALQSARQQGIFVALSRPCFEVWLALHYLDDYEELTKMQNAQEVGEMLKRMLGQYNKRKIDTSGLSFERVARAWKNGRELDSTVGGGDIPEGVTSRVYKVWEAIVAKALPSQLPSELLEILRATR